MAAEPKPALRGVIFDLDGTLADTLDDLTDTLNATLATVGRRAHTSAEVRRLVGDGLPILIRRAAATEDDDLADELVRRFRDLYRQNHLRRTRLYPGIDAALTSLHRSGCAFAVLSNKPDEFTKRICEALLAEWPFIEFAGTRDEYPNKPDPTKALQLANQMQLAAANVVFVGDSDTDVDTARAAGMTAVAVSWGFRDRHVLETSRPDRIVDTPADLPAAVLG